MLSSSQISVSWRHDRQQPPHSLRLVLTIALAPAVDVLVLMGVGMVAACLRWARRGDRCTFHGSLLRVRMSSHPRCFGFAGGRVHSQSHCGFVRESLHLRLRGGMDVSYRADSASSMSAGAGGEREAPVSRREVVDEHVHTVIVDGGCSSGIDRVDANAV